MNKTKRLVPMPFAHYSSLEREFLNPLLILSPCSTVGGFALNYMCKKESRIKSHPVGVEGFCACQKAAAFNQHISCCWVAGFCLTHSAPLNIFLVTLSYIYIYIYIYAAAGCVFALA